MEWSAVPSRMRARDGLARDYERCDVVRAALDRHGETVARIGCLRTEQLKSICHFLPKRSILVSHHAKK